MKKFFKFFSCDPGNTTRASGYNFWAASMEARASKSAFTWVVITDNSLFSLCFSSLFTIVSRLPKKVSSGQALKTNMAK